MSERYPGGYITKNPPAPTQTSAPGVWTLDQALQNVKGGTWPPNGPFYIEDVFSTYLYSGNSSTQSINNGIDLSTKGGMVWLKVRTAAANHYLFDTVRGSLKSISSNTTGAQTTSVDSLTAFNSNGFSLGAAAIDVNDSGSTYASWTFREKTKFFDVVTWTGNGAGDRTISHNLGSVPGCIITKDISNSGTNWHVFHRSINAGRYGVGYLNSTAAFVTGTSYDWDPTSTTFLASAALSNNDNGTNYVAYLFAHDAGGFGANGTDNVISCGSYTGNGSATGPTITLGYEPQWLMIKNASDDYFGLADWAIFDIMRGIPVSGDDLGLSANTTAADANYTNFLNVNATGFNITTANAFINQSSNTYIYIAIRRGPMKTPTTGTSVFYPLTIAQADSIDSTNVPFPPDLVNTFSRNGTDRTTVYNLFQFVDRLRSLGIPNNTWSSGTEGRALISSSTDQEYGQGVISNSYVQLKADSQNITRSTGWNTSSFGNWINYFFRRAPGFFDIVCYTGDGTVGRQVTHNLTVKPELLIVKARSAATYPQWWVWSPINTTTFNRLQLESTAAATNSSYSSSNVFPGEPTSTYFVIGGSGDRILNQNTETFVAYLFASVAGVSKVGSYTGSGTTKQIDCGFTGGARFVLIKRTDSTGGWYVWDSARGIVAGNDPYLLLNSTAAEVTNTDYVDTYSAGFEISSTAPAAINANGGTFIFLAIA